MIPFVNELRDLFKGVLVTIPGLGNRLVWGVLGLASLDWPAVCKAFGFASHNARLGCSKCLTTYQKWDYRPHGDAEKNRDYHRHHASKHWLPAKNPNQRAVELKRYGVRWTAFLHLIYCHPIALHSVDALHALLLGLVKHLFETLTQEGYLTDDKFEYLQSIVNLLQLHLPDEIPGIKHKIESKMSGVSAAQVIIFFFVSLLDFSNLHLYIFVFMRFSFFCSLLLLLLIFCFLFVYSLGLWLKLCSLLCFWTSLARSWDRHRVQAVEKVEEKLLPKHQQRGSCPKNIVTKLS
jgi:hypothetical protein